jgi:hypothetical protein
MTTNMTPVRSQVSNFRPRNFAKCYGGSTHERLLSESSRPYMHMLAFISVCQFNAILIDLCISLHSHMLTVEEKT